MHKLFNKQLLGIFEASTRYGFEAILFLLAIIIIFNELVDFLKILGLYTEESIKMIGYISILLSIYNYISEKVFFFKIK